MDAKVEAFKDAVDKSTGDGRNEELARQLADEFVEAHPELFVQMKTMNVQALAAWSQMFREQGSEEAHQHVEIWLRHRFDPQNIGGTFEPTIRIPSTVKDK